jgi:hypothetical protein
VTFNRAVSLADGPGGRLLASAAGDGVEGDELVLGAGRELEVRP